MQISARNVLNGTVKKIEKDVVRVINYTMQKIKKLKKLILYIFIAHNDDISIGEIYLKYQKKKKFLYH